MEQKILEQFKKKMKMEERNDLIISLDCDDFGNYLNTCEVMEKQTNGKVWDVITTRSGNIKSIYEL